MATSLVNTASLRPISAGQSESEVSRVPSGGEMSLASEREPQRTWDPLWCSMGRGWGPAQGKRLQCSRGASPLTAQDSACGLLLASRKQPRRDAGGMVMWEELHWACSGSRWDPELNESRQGEKQQDSSRVCGNCSQ